MRDTARKLETDRPIWLSSSDIICCAIGSPNSNNFSTRNEGFCFCLASSESKRQNNTAYQAVKACTCLSTSKQLKGFDLNHGYMLILFLLLQIYQKQYCNKN